MNGGGPGANALPVLVIAGRRLLARRLRSPSTTRPRPEPSTTSPARSDGVHGCGLASRAPISPRHRLRHRLPDHRGARVAQQLLISPMRSSRRSPLDTPQSAAGLAELPAILQYFDGVQRTMAAQQQNFEQADAIPTKNLPNTTVHWLFVALGVAAIAIGVAGLLGRNRMLPAGAAVLGVVVVATTLVLSCRPRPPPSTT